MLGAAQHFGETMKYCNETVGKWLLPCGYPRQWLDDKWGGCLVDDDAPVGLPCIIGDDGKPLRDADGRIIGADFVVGDRVRTNDDGSTTVGTVKKVGPGWVVVEWENKTSLPWRSTVGNEDIQLVETKQ